MRVCVHMCVVGMATALSSSHKPDLRLDLCRHTLPSTCSARTLALCYHAVFTVTILHGRVPLCIAPPNSMPKVFCFFFYCRHLATCFRMYSRVASLLLRSYSCTELQRRRCKKIQFVALLRCLPLHCAPNYMCVQKNKCNTLPFGE